MTKTLQQQLKLLVLGGLGLLGIMFSLYYTTTAFYVSYLVVFLYGLSISIGAAFLLLLMHLTRAGWGVPVKRIPEHFMSFLPLFSLFLIPLLFGLDHLFIWLNPVEVAGDYLLQKKAPYLNLPFFIIRNALYCIVFSTVGYYYWRKSLEQDSNPDAAAKITASLQKKSPVAILFLSLATSFMAFDWIMSLYPHWFSTILGVNFFAGCMVAALSCTILGYDIYRLMTKSTTLPSNEHMHELSKLFYGFIIFWSYVSFSQYFLTWYANIPEFTQWYYPRLTGEWGTIFYVLAIGHFVLPLFGFMSRHVKRHLVGRLFFSIVILALHYLDIRYAVWPNFTTSSHISWLEILIMISFLIILTSLLINKICRYAIIPTNDPRLEESKHVENAI
jgi:hypothetical protein